MDQYEQQNDQQISDSENKNGFWKNSPLHFDKIGLGDYVGKLVAIIVGLVILAVMVYTAINYVVSVFE